VTPMRVPGIMSGMVTRDARSGRRPMRLGRSRVVGRRREQETADKSCR